MSFYQYDEKCHPHCNSVHRIQELLDLGPLILSISSQSHACFVFICVKYILQTAVLPLAVLGHASPDSS